MPSGSAPKSFSQMPGPYGWPVFGSAFSLLSFPANVLMKWAKEYYGPVFRYRMISVQCVALNGYEAVKDGLVTNKSKLSGRMTDPFLTAVRNNRGLFFLDHGELWKKWRPLIVSSVSSIMPGLLGRIEDQARKFLRDIELAAPEGSPVNMNGHLVHRLAQTAIISFLNKEHDNTEKSELNDLVGDIYAPFSDKRFMLGLFAPILAYIPPFSSFISSARSRRESMIQKFIQWFEKFESKGNANSIASIFFKEHPEYNSEDMEQLATILMDWIFAGTKTVTEEISWVILFLLRDPESLRRVQEEIDVAMEGVASVAELYGNQEKLPFLNAVIQEGIRLRPIAPGSLYHKTVSEAVVCGYKIPKDVVIIPNLWSVHHDPEYWKPDPDDYRPERHLDSEGKFVRSDHVIPFSIGDRSCAGEKIARAEFFIFVVALLHKYNLELVEVNEDFTMDGQSKAILKTSEYHVILQKR